MYNNVKGVIIVTIVFVDSSEGFCTTFCYYYNIEQFVCILIGIGLSIDLCLCFDIVMEFVFHFNSKLRSSTKYYVFSYYLCNVSFTPLARFN